MIGTSDGKLITVRVPCHVGCGRKVPVTVAADTPRPPRKICSYCHDRAANTQDDYSHLNGGRRVGPAGGGTQ